LGIRPGVFFFWFQKKVGGEMPGGCGFSPVTENAYPIGKEGGTIEKRGTLQRGQAGFPGHLLKEHV